MKIAILSDLHVDLHEEPPTFVRPGSVDAILLAGDTVNGEGCRVWATKWLQHAGVPVFYVTGNHEYYGHDIETLDAACRDRTIAGLHFLQCDEVLLGDYLILGATLWTDFSLHNNVDRAKNQAQAYMLDYREIRMGNHWLMPDDTVAIHQRHRAWLEARLRATHEQGLRTIVMTHHAPSVQSIAPRYAGSDLSAAFASNLDHWMFEPWAPVLWVHGHTHYPVDYRRGRTRIVSNPRGYPYERDTDLHYAWEKVIELPT